MQRLAATFTTLVLGLVLGYSLGACGDGKPPRPDLPRERPKGSVEVISHPAGAAVILEEGERRLGSTPLVIERSGGTGIKMTLVKEGYRPRRSFVLVEEGNRLKHHVRLERERATLVVRAGAMRGANVTINGKPVGLTPTRIEVDAGVELELEVGKNRFQPFRQKLRVQAGETREVNADLLPEGFKGPPPGHLSVQGPMGAVVTLRGRVLGMAPLERIPLPPGRYPIQARTADGKKRWSRTAVVKTGELSVVTLD